MSVTSENIDEGINFALRKTKIIICMNSKIEQKKPYDLQLTDEMQLLSCQLKQVFGILLMYIKFNCRDVPLGQYCASLQKNMCKFYTKS